MVGYEGHYEVSSHGRVRSLGAYWKCYAGRIKKAFARNGYQAVNLCKNGVRRHYSVHRLVLEAFVGADSRDVNHKDGHRDNPVLENLEYATEVENCRHSIDVLRRWSYVLDEDRPRGEQHWNSALTAEAVRDIRSRYASKTISGKALAREYGVDKYTIYAVIHGRTWSHVTD